MNIKHAAITKALAMLQAANAQYKIIDEHGIEYTNINKRERKKSIHPFGSVTAYLKPYVDNIEPGELVEIPAGKFSVDSVQSTVCAYFSKKIGKGSCMTAANKEKNIVEVIRIY